MKTNVFSFIVEDPQERSYDQIEEIIAKDYDDILFGSTNGEFELDFEIKDISMMSAINKAIEYIAPINLVVKRISPDSYVTASEIARRVHISREGVRKMISGDIKSKNTFPRPSFFLSGSSVWVWPVVVRWFYENGKTDIEKVKEAKDIYSKNKELEDVLI